MRVRVVVVTHKALPALKRCVAALRRSGVGRDDRGLSVVDSGSGRDTRSYLRALARPERVWTKSYERNLGKAAAINRAVDADGGRSDWYAVVDDDAVVPPDWLDGLLDAARRRPRAAILGCRIVGTEGRVFAAEMLSWFSSVGHGERDLGQRSYTRDCDAVTGVCMLIRGDVFRKVRFWETLHQPYEDSDFCFSARRAGLSVLYHGAVAVRHLHLARHGARESANRALMEAKWGVRPFADSHPLDAAYARFWSAAEDGDWARALAACRRGLALDPVPAPLRLAAGVCLARLGRPREAEAALALAVSTAAHSPALAARAMKLLESLRRREYTGFSRAWREILNG